MIARESVRYSIDSLFKLKLDEAIKGSAIFVFSTAFLGYSLTMELLVAPIGSFLEDIF